MIISIKRQVKFLFSIILISASVHAQTSVASLVAGTSVSSLPYFTDSARYNKNYDTGKILDINQVKSLIQILSSTKRIVVNPKGGTAFGDLDCPDNTQNCIDTEEIKSIVLKHVFKSENATLAHLQISGIATNITTGILILFAKNNSIVGWLFSDGYANEGNPHGNIVRSTEITKKGIVTIKEVAWGNNTQRYRLEVSYSTVNSDSYQNKKTSSTTFKLLSRRFIQ